MASLRCHCGANTIRRALLMFQSLSGLSGWSTEFRYRTSVSITGIIDDVDGLASHLTTGWGLSGLLEQLITKN